MTAVQPHTRQRTQIFRATDYPTAYLGQPEIRFVKAVPTLWDATRVLEARVGDLLVTARPEGEDLLLEQVGLGIRIRMAIDDGFAARISPVDE